MTIIYLFLLSLCSIVIKSTLHFGVPEGNRTPDPRFRKCDFRVLIGFTPVQERSLRFTKMHETALWADLEQVRTGADNPEQEWSGEAVTGV
jgi:hypothetical protein